MNLVENHINEFIKEKSRVLDVGCGDGSLMQELIQSKQVNATGLEIDSDSINQCIKKQVPVLQLDIEQGFPCFRDNQFDIAIVKQTIQVVRNPLLVFNEVLRVARESLIVFPNFANWRNRLRLLLNGSMPVNRQLPYEWYNTPNIHLMSLVDFEKLCALNGCKINHKIYFGDSVIDNLFIATKFYNLGCSTVLMHLTKR